MTLVRGRARRLLAVLAATAPLLGAAPQEPGYTEETVPSEAAKRDYELCAAEGQAPEQAIERCQAALRHGLSGRVAAHVHILIGWAHWALGRPGPAADSWRAAATFEPRDPSLRLGLGLFLEAAGRTAEAEAAFHEAARGGMRADSDGLFDLVVGYGRGQLSWENFAHVLDRLATALAAEELASEAHEALAAACDAYDKAPGKDAEAVACRRRLIPRGEREARGHLELARSLVDQGRDGLEEAILSFREAVRLDPTLAPAHLGLARALEKQNDPEGALGSYREALRLDPSLSEARQAIAGLEALGFGRPSATPAAAGQRDTPEALAELRRCIDDGRGAACRRAVALGLSPLLAARAWTFLGMAIEAERGEEDVEDGARKAYREALRVRPDYALAHYRLGLLDLYFRPRDAAASLEAALRLRPDWDAAREALARCLAQDRQWDKAAEIHGKVLESRPGDARTARQLADALVNADRWAEAIPHLEIVCRSPLATTNTWVTLGQALQKSSRPDEARTAFLKALDAPGEGDNVDNERIVRSWALFGLDGLGRTEDAIAARRRWLATDPDLQPDAITKKVMAREAWSEARWYRSLHLELAAALDALGRHAEAEQEKETLLVPHRNALAQAPARADLHEELAEALAAAGRTEGAIERDPAGRSPRAAIGGLAPEPDLQARAGGSPRRGARGGGRVARPRACERRRHPEEGQHPAAARPGQRGLRAAAAFLRGREEHAGNCRDARERPREPRAGRRGATLVAAVVRVRPGMEAPVGRAGVDTRVGGGRRGVVPESGPPHPRRPRPRVRPRVQALGAEPETRRGDRGLPPLRRQRAAACLGPGRAGPETQWTGEARGGRRGARGRGEDRAGRS